MNMWLHAERIWNANYQWMTSRARKSELNFALMYLRPVEGKVLSFCLQFVEEN